jgi:hypothetical protein
MPYVLIVFFQFIVNKMQGNYIFTCTNNITYYYYHGHYMFFIKFTIKLSRISSFDYAINMTNKRRNKMKTLLGIALISTFLFIATSSHACLGGHNRHHGHHRHHRHHGNQMHHFFKEQYRKNLENTCKVLNETESEIIMSCPKNSIKKEWNKHPRHRHMHHRRDLHR